MKRIFSILAIAFSLTATAQIRDSLFTANVPDTFVVISNHPKLHYARLAAFNGQNFRTGKSGAFAINATVFAMDSVGHILLSPKPEPKQINTINSWVNSSGTIVPQGTTGAIPEYNYLRAVANTNTGLIPMIVYYMKLADTQGLYNKK